MVGLIYVIIAQFLWAWELILVRKFFPSQNPIYISAMTSVIGAAFYLPFIVVLKQKFAVTQWFVLIILGLTSWFLAQIFYVAGIQRGTNSFAISVVTLTMPLSAVILSALFLKETMTLRILLGGIIMIIGFLIISFK